MSGQKRLKKAIENKRMIAIPTRVRENRDGTKTQLYRIYPMR